MTYEEKVLRPMVRDAYADYERFLEIFAGAVDRILEANQWNTSKNSDGQTDGIEIQK